MKRSSFLKIGVFVFFSLVIASPSFAGGRWSKPGLPDIPGGWSEIDPAEVYPDFEYNGLTPACSACPTCMSDTFEPLDKFTFFAKKGTVNKLVIYFQGGGGCWDSVNCLYAPTYTQQQEETIESFADTEGMGIFDTANPKNPFKNWYSVYIPYCTGDIHWGANDAEYPDIWNKINGSSWTIQHRGFVNFQVVLKWIKANFKRPRKIFVTGISAGSYGAIGGFPFIKKAFPLSKIYVLGDAGNGVTPEPFRDGGFDTWNVQVPDWIPGYEDGYNSEMTAADMYKDYANYYRRSKVAQYTTAWDETQAWYYNLQFGGLVSYPQEWNNFPYDPIYCGWHYQMLEYAFETADNTRNYRYYIAAGTAHTIMMSPSFYTEESAGISFAKWLGAMVGDSSWFHRHYRKGLWKNLQCEDCEDPVVCP